jgi:hypothetical protein
MANAFLDFVAGSDAADGLTAATPKKTFAAAAALLAVGNKLKVKASPAPVQVGGTTSATWNDLARSIAVTWTTQQIKVIDYCSVAWTAGAQGSASSLNTGTFKKSTQNSTSSINTTASVGQIMYRALGGAQDFSAYQTVSFCAKTTVAQTAGTSRMSLRLCSDTAGVTAVNTISIPALTAANRWTLVTVDTGGNLGSAIQSIALYADQANAAATISLDCILACKNGVNALSLTSLIGKGTSGETYYGISSISAIDGNGCTIWLDNQTETLGNATRGYTAQTASLSETLPLWKREPITLTQMGQGLIAAATTSFMTVPLSGTSDAAKIEYEFGYSDLSLSAPDGETWLDCQNGHGNIFVMSAKQFTKTSKLAAVRANNLFNASGASSRNNEFYGIAANNMTTTATSLSQAGRNIVSVDFCNNNGAVGMNILGGNGGNVFYAKQINNNLSNGIFGGINESFLGGLGGSRTLIANNTSQGVSLHSGIVIKNVETRSSAAGAGFTNTSTQTWSLPSFIEDAIVGEASTIIISTNSDAQSFFKKFGGVEGDNRFYMNGATGYQGSGIWRLNLTSATLRPDSMPAEIRLGRIACVANRAVTVTAQMKSDNSAVGCQLVAAGQLAGVPTNVVSSVVGAGGAAYETVSITFTPTESGFIDILWRASTTVANTNAYLQSVSVSGGATADEINAVTFNDRGAITMANAVGGSGGSIGIQVFKH